MNASKRRWLIPVVGVALMMSACGSAGSTQTSAVAHKTAGGLTIGIVLNSAADPNQVNIAKGWTTEGAKYGWTVTQVDSMGNANQANAAMQALVQRKVGAIAVEVYESTALGTGLAAARAAHIPVVLNGSNTLAPGVIATLPVYAGVPQTTRMATDLHGKGTVLEFTFPPGAPCVAEERQADTVLKSYQGITVKKESVPSPGWVEAAQADTSAWLTSHPAGSGPLAIWGCWDGPLIGSIAALRADARTDVKLYGNGGQADALAAVKSGAMTATWFYGDRTGDGIMGANLLHDYLLATKAHGKWKAKTVPVPSIVVDKGNVNAICAKSPKACA